MNQWTIKSDVSVGGVGLHSGKPGTAVLKPAAAGSGIRFVRSDLAGAPSVPASIEQVVGVERGTTLRSGGCLVRTVEHVLAAAFGLGVDNLEIVLDAEEPPAGDGSAKPFVDAIRAAGLAEQSSPRRRLVVREAVRHTRGDVEYVFLPGEGLKLTCVMAYETDAIGTQVRSVQLSPDVFAEEIAPARTFCLESEVQALRERGLGLGGSLENALVVGAAGVKNGPLRFPDEFVRHKMLDLLGDLALLGRRLEGEILAIRPGHANNVAFARAILGASAGAGPRAHRVRKLTRAVGAEAAANAAAPDDHITPPSGRVLNIEQIMAAIPHRPPFLLVDRVVITEEQKKAVGFKNVSMNEPFFVGHFPGRPIMPAVFSVPSLAQTACVLFLSRPKRQNELAEFMGLKYVKFRRPVVPGDVLRQEIEVTRFRERGGQVVGTAYVDGQRAAEATFTFALVDK